MLSAPGSHSAHGGLCLHHSHINGFRSMSLLVLLIIVLLLFGGGGYWGYRGGYYGPEGLVGILIFIVIILAILLRFLGLY